MALLSSTILANLPDVFEEVGKGCIGSIIGDAHGESA